MPGQIVVARFASFEEARESWQALEPEALLYGTQTFEWLAHWYDKVGRANRLQPCVILVSDRAGTPLLLLPLGIRKAQGIASLTWLGGDITDYHAPLVQREFAERVRPDEFVRIWDEVRKALPPHDVVHFEKQPERIEDRPNPVLYLPHQVAYDMNYASRLGADWEAFHHAMVKPTLRADSRRKRRLLAQLGTLRFEVARAAAQFDAISRSMVQQKIQRYLETGTYSLFNNCRYRSFFLEPSRELLQRDLLHVSALKLDDEIIATHWGLVFRGRLYYVMATFAGGPWSKYSPGRLMLEELFQWCFGRGIEVLDFTIGDEPFKRTWSNETHRLYKHMEPLNARGAVYVKLEQAKAAIRRHPAIHRLINRLRNRGSRKTGPND